MRVLRQGMKDGPGENDVKYWQNFLRGLNLYKFVTDGNFGTNTHDATKKFQKQQGLSADGVVGAQTYAKAFESGFDILDDDDQSKISKPDSNALA